MEQGTAAITCSIRGCPNEFGLSDPSHTLYVCIADDIQCKKWLAVIPEVSLGQVDDKLCVCSLHFDSGVNVSGDTTPTIFPPVPGLGTSTSEKQQQQSETHGGDQTMTGPATTIKQELVDSENEIPVEKKKEAIKNSKQGTVLSANSPGMPSHSTTDDDGEATEAAPTDSSRLFTSRWIPRPCPIFRKQRMVKLFSCHLCSFSTIYAYKLKNHIGAHSGERPLCHVCLLSFSDMYGLRRHSLTHTGEKKYKCSLCPYASVTAPLLERHLRTHTGEKNFACSQCPYVFARQDTLKRHIDRVHIRGIKTEDEPV